MNWAGAVFFAMAAVALYSQLSRYTWVDIRGALDSIPALNFGYAAAACACAYLTLSMYDRLALGYIGRKLSWWKWMLTGFLAFAVSNNAGTAPVSGGAIRYRYYTRWKFRMYEIVEMITFSGFTYLAGCLFTIVLGYFLLPDEMRGTSVVALAFWPCLFALLAYWGLAAFYRGELRLGEIVLKMPRLKTALMQTGIGTLDSIFQSLVLYSILYSLFPVSFDVFLGAFVISQVLGVFTPVPGALGVFEGLFIFLLPGAGENTLPVFGALIAYRVVYYLVPLGIAGAVMLIGPIIGRWALRMRLGRTVV